MSVYRHRKSPFYHFDFQIRGIRFSGSTGCVSRRDAERFERDEKDRRRVELKSAQAALSAPMTFAIAAARYYVEVGQHLRGDGAKNCTWSLEWLDREIGSNTLLSRVDSATVARLVAIRRGEGVAPATVNRSVTEQLRKIMNRARDIWNQSVQKIEWRKHMLAEPKERVRVLSVAEEAKLFHALRSDYHHVVQFALMSGCRMCEIVPGKEFPGLKWSDVDWAAKTISLTGKGRVIASIPISDGIRALLFPLQGQHPVYVFTYIAQRRSIARKKGERFPITREGLKSAWRRSKLDARLIDYRFHDNRHTAATSVLRATGNLKIVQRLLRHSNIATTTKYAHVMDEDVRRAMDAAEESRTESRNEASRQNEAIDKSA